MKKYVIIALLGIAAFAGAYYFTRSWKLSLIIIAVIVVYLIWTIGIELKHSKENAERRYQQTKQDHIKKTEDNPTLR